MTALSIQPTFPIFTDIDGQPLESGYIWIGTTNLNPITNPITVYWDAALTLAAVQPIRTIGGYPVNNGTPARLYVNSDYSIQVQNRNGSVVYSAPAATERYGNVISFADITGTLGSDRVSFLQAGSGAVTRTAQAKMRETVSVKDFGAVGDGSTDDTAAIQAAIDAVASAGDGGVVTIPQSSGSYIFTSIQVKTGVTLLGTGGVLKLKNNTCTNASTAYYLINNLGHTDVTYDSLIIDGNRANNTLWLVADAITATGVNAIVRNCRILNTPDSGIMFTDAPNGLCVNNWIDTGGDLGIYVNAADVTPRIGEMNISGNTIKNFPYGGIGVKRSTNSTIVSNNLIYTCGNGITVEDFGSGNHPDHLIITGNLMKNIGYPYDTDPLVAERGIVLNACTNVVVTNNKVQNVSGYGVAISGTTQSVISNNHFTGYPTNPRASQSWGVTFEVRNAVTPSQLTICGNIFRDFVDGGGQLKEVQTSIINDNIFQAAGYGVSIASTCTTNTISLNVFDGTSSDVAELSSASDNIWLNNRYVHGATLWEENGNLRNVSNPYPNTYNTPKYAGQQVLVTFHGPRIYMATGSGTSDWVQVSANMDYRTGVEIADKTNSINTADKYVGKTLWDTTNSRVMVAAGPTDVSRWYVCDGSAFVTPA
jgi:parallel beta-helix repeat protein